jgi:outer membrane protein assembly factor BamB
MTPLRPPRAISVVPIAVLAAGLLASSMTAAAADPTDGWAQFQGDAGHRGTAGSGPTPGYRVAWEMLQEPGGPRAMYGLSAPVVVEDHVVAVGPTQVVAVDPSTGDESWTVERVLGPSAAAAGAVGAEGSLVLYTEGWGDGPPDEDDSSPTAAVSPSPAPTDDDVEVPAARLVGVDAVDGSSVWTVDLPAVSRTGVTVLGDLAVVGSIDGSVTAVEVASGRVAWTTSVGGFLESAIAAADDLVLAAVRGSDDSPTAIVALAAADGEQAWRYEPQTASFGIGPASIGDGAAYVGLPDGTVRSVALADGTERWSTILNAYLNPFAPASPPVIAGEAVIVADVRGQVYRLDAITGERVWDHAYNRPVLRSAPIVVGEHVLVATADGWFAGFDVATGELVWEREVSPSGAGPLRSLAVTGDTVVAGRGGSKAGLVGLQHDPTVALVRTPSPTTFDPRALLLWWAVSLVAAAALFASGRWLWVRLGPPEIPTEDDVQEDAT